MNILFKNIDIVTMDEAGTIYNGYVLIADGKIKYVGRQMPQSSGLLQKVVDGRDKLLLPGLYNCHTHIPMTAMRGYADDFVLSDWLNKKIFPVEDRWDRESVKICSVMGMAEAIATGTVSISDMYFYCDEIASAAAECGLAANIARSVVWEGSEPFTAMSCAGWAEALETADKWHGYDNGRIRVDLSVHAEYTSVPEVWAAVAEEAKRRGLGLQFHLSETRDEHERAKAKYGKTTAQLFYENGLFGKASLAAHGVWLEPEDIALMAETGTSLAHNPTSNLKLASGIAPVARIADAGVNVCLGTDGAASNNSHDMFGEMKLAALLQKGTTLDPTVIPAEQALRMATVNGARAQGRAETSGMIREGLDADLIVLNSASVSTAPCHDPASCAVYSAHGSDVLMTIVKGKLLYDNGEFTTIDREKLMSEFRKKVVPRLFS